MAVIILAVHNIVRWLVLATALVALLRALRGINGGRDYASGARRSVALFVMSVHAQLLLGVVLYGVSPTMRAAMRDMAGAMKDPATRFFLAEHPALMIAAVVAATVTGVLARRGPDDAVRHRRAAIGVALALGLILAGMPWQRGLLPTF